MQKINTTTQALTTGSRSSQTGSRRFDPSNLPTREQLKEFHRKTGHELHENVQLTLSTIPPRYRGMKFKDMDISRPESRQAVELSKFYLDNFRQLSSRGASGFFSGGVGTGKTRLACMICENVSKMGFKAKYITAWQMIQDIRTAYSDKSTSVQAIVARYILVDFLVIDEVGVQNGTVDERVLMDQVIDGRYNHVKSTILISNSHNPVEDGHLDKRAIDRLKEGGGFAMSFTGGSYRK